MKCKFKSALKAKGQAIAHVWVAAVLLLFQQTVKAPGLGIAGIEEADSVAREYFESLLQPHVMRSGQYLLSLVPSVFTQNGHKAILIVPRLPTAGAMAWWGCIFLVLVATAIKTSASVMPAYYYQQRRQQNHPF